MMMMSTIMATDGAAGWSRATSSVLKYGAYAPWDERTKGSQNGNEVSP